MRPRKLAADSHIGVTLRGDHLGNPDSIHNRLASRDQGHRQNHGSRGDDVCLAAAGIGAANQGDATLLQLGDGRIDVIKNVNYLVFKFTDDVVSRVASARRSLTGSRANGTSGLVPLVCRASHNFLRMAGAGLGLRKNRRGHTAHATDLAAVRSCLSASQRCFCACRSSSRGAGPSMRRPLRLVGLAGLYPSSGRNHA